MTKLKLRLDPISRIKRSIGMPHEYMTEDRKYILFRFTNERPWILWDMENRVLIEKFLTLDEARLYLEILYESR